MLRQVIYFDRPGADNSAACLRLLPELLQAGYRDIVIASTTGGTGAAAAQLLTGLEKNLVVVAHSVGFREPNHDEFAPEHERAIVDAGARILRATILTHSLETSLAAAHQGCYPSILIAQALRRLGQGTKVCCEIVMEACDAGLIPEGKEIVAVAGTACGADTVAIVRSAASKRFLDLQVAEFLAKPRSW
ncbi:MAG: hypothetical protein V2A77_05695 [Pseudomonadota bacterium]